MALTEAPANAIADALEEQGYTDSEAGLSVTEETETVHTGRWSITVSLYDGRQPEDIEKIVRARGMPAAEIKHIVEDGLNYMAIS